MIKTILQILAIWLVLSIAWAAVTTYSEDSRRGAAKSLGKSAYEYVLSDLRAKGQMNGVPEDKHVMFAKEKATCLAGFLLQTTSVLQKTFLFATLVVFRDTADLLMVLNDSRDVSSACDLYARVATKTTALHQN